MLCLLSSCQVCVELKLDHLEFCFVFIIDVNIEETTEFISVHLLRKRFFF